MLAVHADARKLNDAKRADLPWEAGHHMSRQRRRCKQPYQQRPGSSQARNRQDRTRIDHARVNSTLHNVRPALQSTGQFLPSPPLQAPYHDRLHIELVLFDESGQPVGAEGGQPDRTHGGLQ